ncbi:protein O-glucosyltransferase 2-like [Bacillus rossius redtenbacheri]|uniref:protein O-glucosyltransferase 2-like n=1 Tax=Bacillus rossius redtenbacheri TaxID=93214 RepID=UPI002FDE2CDE
MCLTLLMGISIIFLLLPCEPVLTLMIDPKLCEVWGPGLSASDIVMPARYFFIQAVDVSGTKLTLSPGEVFTVEISGTSGARVCRVWVNVLDRRDGSFIVRYKVYNSCVDFRIQITHQGEHVADSPYAVTGTVNGEECLCPVESMSTWLKQYGCPSSYSQIDSDLNKFTAVNFTSLRSGLIKRYDHPGSMSICNYVIKDSQIHRKCYGQHVGFKMFVDAILLSLARKVRLPDMEFFFNLGDWPLVKAEQGHRDPVFAWCGSDDTDDIVVPTYDLTEATLECMGRVTLDMLSVQGNTDVPWRDRAEKAFWRGRDSRRERLQLIEIARKHPHLFNASLTNFFFFRDQEADYGPKEKHISFFRFFDYKYVINIDGTVAAYRLPYLLAGGSLVLKQESKYYEFFYKSLEPWKHYVPFSQDLGDLVQRVSWAKQHDARAEAIAGEGRRFAQEHLLPQHVFCYHAVLLHEWSRRVESPVSVLEGMEPVPQPHSDCPCAREASRPHTEL